MPRRQRRSKRRQPASDGWIIWACDGDHPPDTPQTQEAFQEWLTLEYFETPDEIAARWRNHGARALAVWVTEHPGTRPRNWWLYAAPEPLLEGEREWDYLKRTGLLASGDDTGLSP